MRRSNRSESSTASAERRTDGAGADNAEGAQPSAVDDALERWNADPAARTRAWTGVAVASTSQLLYMVDAALIALTLPALEREFSGVSRTTIAWAATGFLVAQASLLLVGGRIGDRHGRKRYFLAGMAVFTIGVLLTSVAPSIWFVIAARVLQGCGAAFLTSGALALVLPMFPTSRSAVVIGAWGVVGSVAAWATPPLGAFVVERSWRLGFALVVPIGIAAIVLGRRVLTETEHDPPSGRTDRLGYLLGPPALGSLMVVLSSGGRWGWLSAWTIGTAAVAVALLVAFVWRCTVADSPLLDLAIMRHRWFGADLAIGALQQMGFFAWFLTAPLIMSGLWGWSVRETGLALAVGQVLSVLGSPIGGQVVLRWGYDAAIVAGAACNVVAMVWVVTTMSSEPAFWWSYLPMALLYGFGNGMCGTVVTGAALAALPQSALGAGNSIVQLTRRMGSALGVAVGVALLGEATGAALLDGARRAWAFVAVLNVAIAVPVLLGRRAARATA